MATTNKLFSQLSGSLVYRGVEGVFNSNVLFVGFPEAEFGSFVSNG